MITCIILDIDKKEIGKFSPKGEKNLLDEAMDNGIELPFSCHAGACMSCAAKIIEGKDLIDEEKDGPKYMETEDDTVLTCIAGVHADKAGDAETHILTIQMEG